MGKLKTSKQLERHFKGIANHWRLDIILLIAKKPDISVEEIVRTLDGNEKTIAEHTRRLTIAGLINKTYKGRNVQHILSPYGEKFVSFIKTFQQT